MSKLSHVSIDINIYYQKTSNKYWCLHYSTDQSVNNREIFPKANILGPKKCLLGGGQFEFFLCGGIGLLLVMLMFGLRRWCPSHCMHFLLPCCFSKVFIWDDLSGPWILRIIWSHCILRVWLFSRFSEPYRNTTLTWHVCWRCEALSFCLSLLSTSRLGSLKTDEGCPCFPYSRPYISIRTTTSAHHASKVRAPQHLILVPHSSLHFHRSYRWFSSSLSCFCWSFAKCVSSVSGHPRRPGPPVWLSVSTRYQVSGLQELVLLSSQWQVGRAWGTGTPVELVSISEVKLILNICVMSWSRSRSKLSLWFVSIAVVLNTFSLSRKFSRYLVGGGGVMQHASTLLLDFSSGSDLWILWPMHSWFIWFFSICPRCYLISLWTLVSGQKLPQGC